MRHNDLVTKSRKLDIQRGKAETPTSQENAPAKNRARDPFRNIQFKRGDTRKL